MNGAMMGSKRLLKGLYRKFHVMRGLGFTDLLVEGSGVLGVVFCGPKP